MITARTKKQLIAFVILTLVGVSFVGARYARLDRLLYSTSYAVNTELAQSGGIFTGAEVTYRGVGIGRVSDMKLTKNGVDAVLDIDNKYDKIPSDTLAVVGNKSAVGEQYVELQPQKNGGPFLKDGSKIAQPETRTPVPPQELLTNLDAFVRSVPQSDLRTVVAESGAAFKDAGPSLGQIIDTSNSFIRTANDNFATTSALIRDSRVVLQTQVDKGSDIRSFSRDLALFTGTLAGSDADLRKLIDNGSATANQLRSFLQQNRVNLGQLINNLVTTNQIVVKHLNGIRQLLIVYPYVVAGGFTVAQKTGNNYNARFGLILQQSGAICKAGYVAPRSPKDLSERPMPTNVGCKDGSKNPRGAEKTPANRVGADYRAPVATYDSQTGKVSWADQDNSAKIAYDGGAEQLYGADSWKSLLLSPSVDTDQE